MNDHDTQILYRLTPVDLLALAEAIALYRTGLSVPDRAEALNAKAEKILQQRPGIVDAFNGCKAELAKAKV